VNDWPSSVRIRMATASATRWLPPTSLMSAHHIPSRRRKRRMRSSPIRSACNAVVREFATGLDEPYRKQRVFKALFGFFAIRNSRLQTGPQFAPAKILRRFLHGDHEGRISSANNRRASGHHCCRGHVFAAGGSLRGPTASILPIPRLNPPSDTKLQGQYGLYAFIGDRAFRRM